MRLVAHSIGFLLVQENLMRLNKTLNVSRRLGKRAYGLYSRTRASWASFVLCVIYFSGHCLVYLIDCVRCSTELMLIARLIVTINI